MFKKCNYCGKIHFRNKAAVACKEKHQPKVELKSPTLRETMISLRGGRSKVSSTVNQYTPVRAFDDDDLYEMRRRQREEDRRSDVDVIPAVMYSHHTGSYGNSSSHSSSSSSSSRSCSSSSSSSYDSSSYDSGSSDSGGGGGCD